MKILITGANGYIGSRVVSYLCNKGFETISADIDNSHLDVRTNFKKIDILNNSIENLFDYFEKPDICLHLAWRDGFVHNSDKHMLDLSSHFRFLQTLIKYGLKNLAIMGTMHEIGYHVGSINEDTPCNPSNFYGVSKNCLREATKLLCEQYGCTWKWLRAFYIYGNDEFGESVFCKLNKAFKSGLKEFNLTTGKNEFDFINVDDLARLISLTIIQNDINGIINVSSGKPISLREQIMEYVQKNKINLKLNWGVYPERESESKCIYGDNTKISEILKKSELKEKGEF